MSAPRRAVFDCNVYLQAMLSETGAANACWNAVVAGEAELFVTGHIVAEIRRLPDHPRLVRKYRRLTPELVERFIEELLDSSTLMEEPPALFGYPRDPDDAHYVNLAIATGAMLVVSNDKDLLDLMNDQNPAGHALRQSYPAFNVLTPAGFLAELRTSG